MAKIGSLKIYVALGVITLIFLPPFAKYQELKYKNKKLEERIAALKVENKRMEEERRRLETDIGYVEQKARQRIGVVRKGEIVIKDFSPKR